MTESLSRYVPGTWLGLVADGTWLLADAASGSAVEACWQELRAAGPNVSADVILDGLHETRAGDPGGFALVYLAGGATHVVVQGTPVAEITGADGGVRVVREQAGRQMMPGELISVRLKSATDGVHESAALPIESGIVLASALIYIDEDAAGSVRTPHRPAPEQVARHDAVEAYLDDFMEPGDGRTPLVEASDLDWMSTPSEPVAPVPVSAPEPESEPEPEPQPEAEPEPRFEPTAVDRSPHALGEMPLPPTPDQTMAAPLPDPALPTPFQPPLIPQPPAMFGATDQPLVTAVRCPSGHLTSTESIYCRVCRAALAPQEPVTVARPCLGRLRLSNGEVYLLDRDAVFGRKPEIPAGRPGPRPNAIVLTDDRDVSRNHVEIRLDGWRVIALDLGSMNGTQLAAPNLAPRLLAPGTAQEIGPGSVLTLAPDVWIYFEEER